MKQYRQKPDDLNKSQIDIKSHRSTRLEIAKQLF